MGELRWAVLLIVVVGCAPAAKSNRCAYAGDFGGSMTCSMLDVTWNSSSNLTLMALASPDTAQPLLKVDMQIAGVPTVGELSLAPQPSVRSQESGSLLGCSIWFFSDEAVPYDNTRNSALFGGDPAANCTLRLEEVVQTSDTTFELHGTLAARLAGGHSSVTPGVKHAELWAGF